jgi:hypothetical protein
MTPENRRRAIRFAAKFAETYPSFDTDYFIQYFSQSNATYYDAYYLRAMAESHGEDYADRYANYIIENRVRFENERELELEARKTAELYNTDSYDGDTLEDARSAALYSFKSDVYANAYAFCRSREMTMSEAESYATYREKLEIPHLEEGFTPTPETIRAIRDDYDLSRHLLTCIGFRVNDVGIKPTKVEVSDDCITLLWEGVEKWFEVCLDAQYLVTNDSQCSFRSSVEDGSEQGVYQDSDDVWEQAKFFTERFCQKEKTFLLQHRVISSDSDEETTTDEGINIWRKL